MKICTFKVTRKKVKPYPKFVSRKNVFKTNGNFKKKKKERERRKEEKKRIRKKENYVDKVNYVKISVEFVSSQPQRS